MKAANDTSLTRPGLDKRGVVVKVYAYEGNDAELCAYENGQLGKYYN